MDDFLTKSRAILSTSNGGSSNGSQEEIKVSPTDFLSFLPWACAQLDIDAVLEISRVVQMEQHRGESRLKTKSKYNIKKDISKKTMASSSLIGLGTSVLSIPEHKIVRMEATFSGANLVYIKIHKSRYLPRGILIILNLVAEFYPYLYGITINSGADKYTIYELSKFLLISNITEVNLDNTYVKEGNHDIILDKANQLKVLSLARCKLDDHVIEKIVSKLEYPLPASETLAVLNLSTNRLTDKGAKSIAKMLRTNRKLSYLNIAGNMVTDHGLEAILSVLYKFPLTIEEILLVRKRYMKHLKSKQELINENMQKLREADIERRRKLKKPNISFQSSWANLEKAFYEKAVKMTELVCEEFNDPFGKDTISADGLLYSNGNNTLACLNFAYNSISWCSTTMLLKVLQHQNNLSRNPKGLVYVCLEGNPLPKDDSTLSKIESLLTVGLSKAVSSVQKKKRENSKPTVS